MSKQAAILCVLLLAGLADFSQEKKEPPHEEFNVPPEEVKRENQVKFTESSIAEGRRLYASQCTMCHGRSGDGKGDLAVELKFKMRDWRDPAALKDMTDGELNYILTKGKGRMPDQGDRLKPEQRWHLVNFIRSLAKKESHPEPKK